MRADGNNSSPLRLIVSGGIGSGKSTVLGMLAARGVVVIEADRIGHQVLQPDGSAFAAVAARWPSVVIEGQIDRSRLAAIVFNDGEALGELEAITHPPIAAEIARMVAEAGEHPVALELPLRSDLAGPGWTRIVVDAPAAVRLRRAVDRGMEEDDAEARIATQPDDVTWRGFADMVIDNTGTLEDLQREVERVWRVLTTA